MIRQERHKAHVLSLLAMAMIRNRWLNDKELQVREKGSFELMRDVLLLAS
jgi:hypothetical protein